MQVSYLIIAKERQMDSVGNPNFLGVLHAIHAPTTPVGVKELPVYSHFIAQPDESGRKHRLMIHVIDEDGVILMGIQGDLSISTSAKEPIALDSHLGFKNLVFPKFGWYTVNLFLDDELKHSYPFQVIEHKTA